MRYKRLLKHFWVIKTQSAKWLNNYWALMRLEIKKALLSIKSWSWLCRLQRRSLNYSVDFALLSFQPFVDIYVYLSFITKILSVLLMAKIRTVELGIIGANFSVTLFTFHSSRHSSRVFYEAASRINIV